MTVRQLNHMRADASASQALHELAGSLLASILSLGSVILLVALLAAWVTRRLRRRQSGAELAPATTTDSTRAGSPEATPERVG